MTSLTWRHDVTKITTWHQETNCLHTSLQMCSKADSISFLWFLWLLNSTWLLSSYLHNGITSRNDVMTSLNMLYLSQLVDVLARWFFFCFYSILYLHMWSCFLMNYVVLLADYVKRIFSINEYNNNVIKWRYDVMAWIYNVTLLTPSILACGVARQMIRCPCIHGCSDHSIRNCHSISTGMMTLLYEVTSWSWRLVTISLISFHSS